MPRTPQRLAGRIWVSGVTLLIAFIAYTSQIFIIWPWYGSTMSVDLILLLGPFNLVVAFLYWNYFLCVYTDPGTVPKTWKPDFMSQDGIEVKTITGKPRYCRHCECYKPPRAHHCKSCRRCVLRMDHHCPWVDNCVGHFNYAHFIRFLWAVDIACSYHLAMISRRVWYALIYSYWEPSGVELAWLVANYAACLPVIVAVGVFSIYHFYCLLTNSTTVEGWEKDKVATLIRRGKIEEVKFPYDLGITKNFTSVFGSNPIFWCWPLRQESTSGLRFPVAAGSESSEQYSWPPKDPYKDSPNDRSELPSDPWTFGNGGLNPSLRPSNTAKTDVPPYHPSFRGRLHDRESDGSVSSSPERESHSSNEYPPYDGTTRPEQLRGRNGLRLRRGSEGWEATMPDRWRQLQEAEMNDFSPLDVASHDSPSHTNRGRQI